MAIRTLPVFQTLLSRMCYNSLHVYTVYIPVHCAVCLKDTPRDLSSSEGGRQSPIGGPGGGEGKDRAAWQDYGQEGSEPSSSESVPSSSMSGQLSGSQANRLETSAAGRTQPERPDAKTSVSTLKEDSEHETAATKGKSQKSTGRKWPLGGFWEGIKGKLKSKDEKGGGREESSDAAETGENGQDVTAVEEETQDVGQKKYSELVAREKVIFEGVLGEETEMEREERRRKNEQAEKRGGKSHKRPQSHRVSRIVQARENMEEGSSGSVEGRHDGDKNYQPHTATHGGRVRKAVDSRPTRPSPNPKPASLKVAPKELGGSNSDRENSSEPTRPGESQRPPQPITYPHNTTQPRTRTAIPHRTDQQPTTQSQVTTTNPLQPRGIREPLATTTTNTAGRARHDVHEDTAQISDPYIRQLLTHLQQQASENDYYQLLGVDPSVSSEELARVRREKSRQLHPDHFANQPDIQERYM